MSRAYDSPATWTSSTGSSGTGGGSLMQRCAPSFRRLLRHLRIGVAVNQSPGPTLAASDHRRAQLEQRLLRLPGNGEPYPLDLHHVPEVSNDLGGEDLMGA